MEDRLINAGLVGFAASVEGAAILVGPSPTRGALIGLVFVGLMYSAAAVWVGLRIKRTQHAAAPAKPRSVKKDVAA